MGGVLNLVAARIPPPVYCRKYTHTGIAYIVAYMPPTAALSRKNSPPEHANRARPTVGLLQELFTRA